MLKILRAKTGQLQLWKVVRGDGRIGIWCNTVTSKNFKLGKNN
ncbi:hypothetical protein LCGC14_3118100, partial [marine sediment metagenome]